MMNKTFKQIKKEIKSANNIGLFCHRSPDMDCLGSMFALGTALEKMGKNVTLFCDEKLTSNQSKLVDKDRLEKNKLDANDFDLFISVDVAGAKQLGNFEQFFTSFPLTARIDHHKRDDDYALISFIDNTRSSCCEIVLDFIEYLGVKITPEIATYLYAGLSSDTNSFVNLNTNEKSFKTAMKLFNYGANITMVNEVEYRTISEKNIAMKKVLYHKVKLYKEGFAICLISNKDLKDNKADKTNCSTFSTEMVSIDGINMSCSIIEKEKDVYSLSFRSKRGYSSYQIAIQFGGGGHNEASGATFIADDGQKVIDSVVNVMRTYLKERANNE
jgi:phosphoesterase RecJ-like protein